MARRTLLRTSEYPYHIYARANNQEAFPGELRYVWKTFTGELFLQQVLREVRVHAFVLMPNHFHLLASSPGMDISLVMRDFISASTRILNAKSQRSGRIFGGRYGWTLVTNAAYYAHVYKYVIRNPAKAGLCECVSDYPFSSYAGEIGNVPLPLRILPPNSGFDKFVPCEAQRRDDWLNDPHPAELNEAIRKGLRKKEFKINPARRTRRKLDLKIDAQATPKDA